MPYVARVDRPHEDVSFNDFYLLSPLFSGQGQGAWRSLQTRRWNALLDLLDAFRHRDEETWQHCRRVQEYASNLGSRLKLTSSELLCVRMSALVHDIGKMAISDAILLKEDRLTDDEFTTIRMHTEVGEKLIQPLLAHASVLAGIRHHHERMDGNGYPDRLTGHQIPLIARIISIADVFDALTQIRPYRRHQLTSLEAIEVMEAQSTGQLDPELICQFSDMIRSSAETVIEMKAYKE